MEGERKTEETLDLGPKLPRKIPYLALSLQPGKKGIVSEYKHIKHDDIVVSVGHDYSKVYAECQMNSL